MGLIGRVVTGAGPSFFSPSLGLFGSAGLLGSPGLASPTFGVDCAGYAKQALLATCGAARPLPVYGAGMEYDLGWGIGFLEYLHSDTSGWDFLSLRGQRLSLESSQDVVRFGLKFKVGHDHSHDVYRRPDGLK